MNWVDKYKPQNSNQIVGHNSDLEVLKKCILEKKPVILYGDTGIGKTSSVYAMANDLGCEILEVNASDKRNSDQVLNVIGNSAVQMSLFNKKKVILVDEVDGISGNQDRGGISAIIEILGKSTHSIVFTCNDVYSKKLASLRKKCTVISLKKLNYLGVAKRLREILTKEGIEFNEEVVKEIAKKSNGDLRAAINDIQILSSGGGLFEIDVGDREKKEQVFNVLKAIFKSKNVNEINKTVERMNLELDELLLWLDENLPYEYKRLDDLFLGLEKLSKADMFKGRIIKRQYWRFLVYVNILSTLGISLSKKDRYEQFFVYRRPSRILKMWMAKQKNNKKNLIAENISNIAHCSVSKARKEILPYVDIMTQNGFNFEGDLLKANYEN